MKRLGLYLILFQGCSSRPIHIPVCLFHNGERLECADVESGKYFPVTFDDAESMGYSCMGPDDFKKILTEIKKARQK